MKIGSATIETKHSQATIPGTDPPTWTRKSPPCLGLRSDGLPCRQRSVLESGAHQLCGMHWNKKLEHWEQRRRDLRDYEEYQRLAFGGIVRAWTAERLDERLLELADITGDEGDTHYRRLRAERDAIEAELKRRKERP